MTDRLIKFCMEQQLVVFLVAASLVAWGLVVSPFEIAPDALPRAPIPVDAIPDLGENQQIVFTEWPGRSPQDVEDQVTYPLTTALLGLPGVRDIRSNSMFGFSSIYVIFNEGVDFYWSRSRILEKLNSLPAGMLPADATPLLAGCTATACTPPTMSWTVKLGSSIISFMPGWSHQYSLPMWRTSSGVSPKAFSST